MLHLLSKPTTDRLTQTNRQTERQRDRQADRQTEEKLGRHTQQTVKRSKNKEDDNKYKYKYKIKTYNAPYVTKVIRRRGDDMRLGSIGNAKKMTFESTFKNTNRNTISLTSCGRAFQIVAAECL